MKKELFKKTTEAKVFRDPIHGYIHVDYQIIYNLINCPSFQRLRRIRQLGATYIVYPTAEHNRFAHSLGVYEIASRLTKENEYIARSLSEEEKLYVMIAALLHDIGHGPFSHVFERVTGISHEWVSAQLILEPSDIHEVLESYQDGLSQKIASIIDHTYPKKLCWQMISSQLDADRMDYLLRDAYFTGTKYGEFDLERILRTLRVDDLSLVVKASGIYAVEDYLMARFHMFWQVYYHVNIRIYEQILLALSKRIASLPLKKEDEFMGYEKLIHPAKVDLKQYLAFDDSAMVALYKKLCDHEDPIVKDLACRLLNRQLFKEYPASDEKIAEFKEKLINKQLDPEYYLLSDSEITNATSPYISTGKEKINILMEDQSIKEFSEVSAIMKSLSQTSEEQKRYLFVPEDL